MTYRPLNHVKDPPKRMLLAPEQDRRRQTRLSGVALLVKRLRQAWPKVEIVFRGANLRYIVTSLKEAPQYLYDSMYCARSDMENQIKEQQ